MEHQKRAYIDPEHPDRSYCEIPEGPIILDFTGCKYLTELHTIIKERFGLPDYYGENWDALWDCIGYYTREPLTVKVRGLATLPRVFDEEIEEMWGVFERVHKTTPNIVFECEWIK